MCKKKPKEGGEGRVTATDVDLCLVFYLVSGSLQGEALEGAMQVEMSASLVRR